MNNVYRYSIWLLLTMFCINMGSLEKYILLALTCVYLCSCKFILRFSGNPSYVFLSLWGITYWLMWLLEENDVLVGFTYYILGPLILGKCFEKIICEHETKDIESSFNYLLVAVSFAFFIHGAIDTIYSMLNNIFVNNSELVYDVITGNKINRTIVGLYLTPIVCVSVPILFLGKKYVGRIIRMLVIVCALVAVLFSVFLGNRTLLVIAASEVFFCYFYGLRTKAKKMSFILIPIIGILIVSVLWSENIAGIKNFFAESFLMRRIVNHQLSNSRLDIYKQVFGHVSDYFFGWMSAGGTGAGISLAYAHNLWIDCLLYAGIIPCLFLIMYTISVIKSAFRLFRTSDSPLLQTMTVCFVLGLMLNWCVEPVLYADPYYFAAICGCFLCIDSVYHTVNGRKNVI